MNNLLQIKNSHERDNNIEFEENKHIYTINGEKNYTSVTTFVHSNFSKFDSDAIITNMMNSKKWQNNKYYGKTKNEIKLLWKKNGQESARLGTKLHYNIESFYNNNPINDNTVEYTFFENFYNDFSHLTPYRTEWMVYDEELRWAGSIDMVFENSDGTLQIYDWKRCKEITKTSYWNKFSLNSKINDIPDTNFWHYALQLNIYKYILEKNYNKIVTELYLVILHPNNSNYIRLSVPNLNNTIFKLVT